MNRITSTNLTLGKIARLHLEAGMAGDTALCRTCERAMDGSKRARLIVARILREAAARA
jgi:hypothetical protein